MIYPKDIDTCFTSIKKNKYQFQCYSIKIGSVPGTITYTVYDIKTLHSERNFVFNKIHTESSRKKSNTIIYLIFFRKLTTVDYKRPIKLNEN
ncbi:hypothetical protein HanIR_Chr08g0366091 [Helianthus annuus]|nr:hypothetical protein HanIR_Chr08g0366091 [Helianthus annuus]